MPLTPELAHEIHLCQANLTNCSWDGPTTSAWELLHLAHHLQKSIDK